eukprot:3696397-Alexandrium_andersonii.AAC.1
MTTGIVEERRRVEEHAEGREVARPKPRLSGQVVAGPKDPGKGRRSTGPPSTRLRLLDRRQPALLEVDPDHHALLLDVQDFLGVLEEEEVGLRPFQ